MRAERLTAAERYAAARGLTVRRLGLVVALAEGADGSLVTLRLRSGPGAPAVDRAEPGWPEHAESITWVEYRLTTGEIRRAWQAGAEGFDREAERGAPEMGIALAPPGLWAGQLVRDYRIAVERPGSPLVGR